MCGRYLIDFDDDRELMAIVQEAQERLQKRSGDGSLCLNSGEIRPTQQGPVLKLAGCHLYADAGRWGFPFQKQQVFLARLETILQKPMFSESMLYRRCIVPASGFYEWSHGKVKKKYYFQNRHASHLYMAGIWRSCEDGEHFVIVTTEADDCMRQVHDRMPVVLTKEEAQFWLGDWQSACQVAVQARPELEKQCCEAYEQLTLFEL